MSEGGEGFTPSIKPTTAVLEKPSLSTGSAEALRPIKNATPLPAEFMSGNSGSPLSSENVQSLIDSLGQKSSIQELQTNPPAVSPAESAKPVPVPESPKPPFQEQDKYPPGYATMIGEKGFNKLPREEQERIIAENLTRALKEEAYQKAPNENPASQNHQNHSENSTAQEELSPKSKIQAFMEKCMTPAEYDKLSPQYKYFIEQMSEGTDKQMFAQQLQGVLTGMEKGELADIKFKLDPEVKKFLKDLSTGIKSGKLKPDEVYAQFAGNIDSLANKNEQDKDQFVAPQQEEKKGFFAKVKKYGMLAAVLSVLGIMNKIQESNQRHQQY